MAYADRLGFEKISHRPHFQKLAYDYLVERLSVYSGFLAGIAKLPYVVMPGCKKLLIPYFASQYLMVLRKKR